MGGILASTGLIQTAASSNNTALLKVLLDAGVDPNEELEPGPWDRGEDPTLALRDATFNGSEDAVCLLLKYGADVELVGKGKYRNSAMDLAKKRGYQGIVRLLEQDTLAKSKL